MHIGLIDVDCHASKPKWGATVYPNLALAKLARYHRSIGDTVEWALPATHYDILYISKIFNFSPDVNLTLYLADRIVRGGSGYDLSSRLPDYVDCLQPDYSIYPSVPSDTAYGFLTRGCPNSCSWCIVPRKEGRVAPYMDVDALAIEGRTKLVLMDNNILAAGDYAVSQLNKIISRGYRIDFNQALDARLVDDRLAALLARCRWLHNRIRFGCDTHAQIAHVEAAIARLQTHGYRGGFFLYTMLGGPRNSLSECYSRIHHFWLIDQAFRAHRGYSVVCHAQPYRDPDNPHAPIPQWQRDLATWCNKHMLYASCDFPSFSPRRGFTCSEYFKEA